MQLGNIPSGGGSPNNIVRSKPDPEVIKACEYMGEIYNNYIAVEDAHVGIDVTKALGMIEVGIGAASGCDKLYFSIKSFGELLNIIG